MSDAVRTRRGAARRSRMLALPLAFAVLAPGASARAGTPAPAPICAIDMGSNSFKRIVGSFADGRYAQTAFEKQTLGVGDDLSRHGRISGEKLAEIETTLAEFRARCEQDGAARVVAVGTAAFREAPNGERVVAIAAKLGIPMEIASEQRESELAYLVGSLGEDGLAVVDNGSRSIELVSKQPGHEPRWSVSTLGYRIAWEKCFAGAASAAAGAAAFREHLKPEIAGATGFMRGHGRLVGVEFEELAEVLFEPQPTEGRVLALADLQRRLREIEASGEDGFAKLRQVKDIDRALPRLVVAVAFAEAFGYSELVLTARELGTGLIIEAGLARR